MSAEQKNTRKTIVRSRFAIKKVMVKRLLGRNSVEFGFYVYFCCTLGT